MMPVVLAAIGEGEIVGAVGLRIEHDALLAVAADAFALEIREVRRDRRGTESPAPMPGDARLGDDAAMRAEQPASGDHIAAAAEGRAADTATAAP